VDNRRLVQYNEVRQLQYTTSTNVHQGSPPPAGAHHLLSRVLRSHPPRSSRSGSPPNRFARRAASTSSGLNMSLYAPPPPRTVLGVAVPRASTFLRRRSSWTRARSADSRLSRASRAVEEFEGAAAAAEEVEEICGGGREGRVDEDEDAREEREVLMNVSGSCVDLRTSSRFLCHCVSLRVNALQERTNRRRSSPCGSCDRSLLEYHGFRSFSEGARRTPFSSSDAGTVFFAMREDGTQEAIEL
jgi:hypothetical protein